MKNLTRFCQFILLAVMAISCTVTDEGPPGPRGPQGPQGPAGEDGGLIVALSYEIPGITFNASNDYQVRVPFPEEDLDLIFPSDKVLVYFLWEENPDYDLWRPLPQTLFNEYGTYVYNYDFTSFDVNFFMDANFSLNLLGANQTDNWIARVVIVPAEDPVTLRSAASVDYSNYTEVVDYYNIDEKDFVKINNTRE